MEKNNYRVTVDSTNPQAAIALINERTQQSIYDEFLAGINDDGSVPRGLMAGLAKKYGYTQAGISRILNAKGIKRKNVINQ